MATGWRFVSLVNWRLTVTARMALTGMGLEGPALAPAAPETALGCIPYVEQLDGLCDVLLLPLGLPNAISLDIAREVHRQKAAFRTVLVTGSFTATAATTAPLFDYIAADRSLELPAVLRRLVAEPVPPRLGRDAVERQMTRLIYQENCFDLINPAMSGFLRPHELQERDKRFIQQQFYITKAWGDSLRIPHSALSRA